MSSAQLLRGTPINLPAKLDVTDCPARQMSYNREAERLASFQNWLYDFIDKNKLALYGFYSMGQNDTVKCYFCRVEIGQWDVGDNVLREHMRWSPHCPFLKRQSTDNEPIDQTKLDDSLPPPTFDICGNNEIENRPRAYPENDPPPSYTNNYPDFSLESDRLKSFEYWPKAIKQKPVELSEAGFFYIGKGDQVKCFSCGGGLKDWEECDVPWEQHALWYPKCHYLNLIKDTDFIEKVKLENEPNGENDLIIGSNLDENIDVTPKTSNDVKNLPSAAVIKNNVNSDTSRDISSLDETKLCKICYNDELNTALFPCMHIIACAKCAVALTTCPICRTKITEIKRIYFS